MPPRKSQNEKLTNNLFSGFDNSHFNEFGHLNKKGINTLLTHLDNKNSSFYSALGDAATEIFFDDYSNYNNNRSLTQNIRDLIIVNTVLFNGDSSSIVKQTEHLFSLIKNEDTVHKLKKSLIKMVTSLEDESSFISSYNSFMDIYLSNSASHGLNKNLLSHELNTVLIIARAKIRGLREFDFLYLKTFNKKEKKRVLRDSEDYLRRVSRGLFPSSLSILKFFNERGYTSTVIALQDGFSQDKRLFSDTLSSYEDSYTDYRLREGIVSERLGGLQRKIQDLLNSYNGKRRR